jgi:hypothetical protein
MAKVERLGMPFYRRLLYHPVTGIFRGRISTGHF